MHKALKLLGIAVALCYHFCKTPDSVDESLAALNSGIAPGSSLFVVTHKENVRSENVCTELVNNLVGVNNVALGLGHLFAVGAEDKTLSRSLGVGLGNGNFSEVIEEFIPES